MNIENKIQSFIGGKKIAVVGVSASGAGFGAKVYRDLKAKGYSVFAINPKAAEFEGDPCYRDLASLRTEIPDIDGAVLVVPPAITESVVEEAAGAGITRIWMQEGAESAAAIELCKTNSIEVVHGRCVMVETD